MHITIGGILWILVFVLIGVGVVFFRRWRSGKRALPSFGGKLLLKKTKELSDTVLCMNDYPDRIVCENMMRSVVEESTARHWKIGKDFYVQMKPGQIFEAVKLPEKISFPPSKLARMLGCTPRRNLKSLKFSRWEELAPYAPVVALAILAILLIIVF